MKKVTYGAIIVAQLLLLGCSPGKDSVDVEVARLDNDDTITSNRSKPFRLNCIQAPDRCPTGEKYLDTKKIFAESVN